jgi:hypothetical protein
MTSFAVSQIWTRAGELEKPKDDADRYASIDSLQACKWQHQPAGNRMVPRQLTLKPPT